MDEERYYRWIDSLNDFFVKCITEEIKRTLGMEKEFIRSAEKDLIAAKCSEAMIQEGVCRPFFTKNHNPDEKEFHRSIFSYYNDWEIKQAIEKMAYGFLESPDHYLDFKFFPVIGMGIAVKKIGEDRVCLYFTLLLGKEASEAILVN